MANSIKWPSDDRVLNGDHSRYPTYTKIEPSLGRGIGKITQIKTSWNYWSNLFEGLSSLNSNS